MMNESNKPSELGIRCKENLNRILVMVCDRLNSILDNEKFITVEDVFNFDKSYIR